MYEEESPIQREDDIDRDKTTLMKRRQFNCFSYCLIKGYIQIQGNRVTHKG